MALYYFFIFSIILLAGEIRHAHGLLSSSLFTKRNSSSPPPCLSAQNIAAAASYSSSSRNKTFVVTGSNSLTVVFSFSSFGNLTENYLFYRMELYLMYFCQNAMKEVYVLSYPLPEQNFTKVVPGVVTIANASSEIVITSTDFCPGNITMSLTNVAILQGFAASDEKHWLQFNYTLSFTDERKNTMSLATAATVFSYALTCLGF